MNNISSRFVSTHDVHVYTVRRNVTLYGPACYDGNVRYVFIRIQQNAVNGFAPLFTADIMQPFIGRREPNSYIFFILQIQA